jgi:hypothetical protein
MQLFILLLSSTSSTVFDFIVKNTQQHNMDRKTMAKFLICSFYAKSGNVDYTNLVVVAKERKKKVYVRTLIFTLHCYEQKKNSPWRIMDEKGNDLCCLFQVSF